MYRTDNSLQLVNEIQNLEIATYVTDCLGRIHGSNDTGAAIFGYRQQDLIGQTEDIFFSHYSEKPGSVGDHYAWRVRKNSELFYAKEEIIPISESDGDSPKLYVRTVEDMSSHLSLLEKCDLWFSHFKDSHFGAHVADTKTRHFLYINDLLAARLGHTSQELIGAYAPRFIEDAELKVMQTKIYEHVEEKGRHQFDFRYKTRHGLIFPMTIETACLRDDAGNIAYRLSLSRLNSNSPNPESYLS